MNVGVACACAGRGAKSSNAPSRAEARCVERRRGRYPLSPHRGNAKVERKSRRRPGFDAESCREECWYCPPGGTAPAGFSSRRSACSPFPAPGVPEIGGGGTVRKQCPADSVCGHSSFQSGGCSELNTYLSGRSPPTQLMLRSSPDYCQSLARKFHEGP